MKIGDIVSLMSGSPNMTVQSAGKPLESSQYIASGLRKTGWLKRFDIGV
jgi:uncharacterized protein YodC (DUF2158 family)